jgi:ubiquinone/menaquinone biosynthesis C-methylase UbiE
MRARTVLVPVALAASLFLSRPAAAQLLPRPTDEWIKQLDSPERVAGLKVEEILARLKLKPGDVVADVGAGPGVFSLPLAKAVSPGGRVYAIEIDQQFLDYIARKAKDQQVGNVQPVLGKFTDPALPASDVDLAFIHDVLHHIEDRAGYLKALSRYIKPSGRIVVIDMFAAHKDQPGMQVSPEQTAQWLAADGFKPVQEVTDLFTDKWFVIYGR